MGPICGGADMLVEGRQVPVGLRTASTIARFARRHT
jgi:hypothetical protein